MPVGRALLPEHGRIENLQLFGAQVFAMETSSHKNFAEDNRKTGLWPRKRACIQTLGFKQDLI
jgi:hypothetical protein